MDVEAWPTIVVLDHLGANRAVAPGPEDAFWITLSDWLELHRAIRSTTGLLDYVYRVLASKLRTSLTLGVENQRFAQVVAADEDYAGSDRRRTHPYLDYSSLEDPRGVDLYRDLLERVWPEDGSLPQVPIGDYRRLMEHLDGLPPSRAAAVGKWIAAKRRHLRMHKSWASGAFLTGNRLTLYACDHADNYDSTDSFDDALLALVTVRGQELLEQGSDCPECAAVGVLKGPTWTDYRFAFSPTPVDVAPGLRLATELRHGVFDLAARRVRWLDIGRNSKCPCGSGRKFKVCHGP